VIAILCVFSLVLVACGDDDDGETSLQTFCEKNEELEQANAELFAPPFDETPEEVEAIATESVAIDQEMDGAAPEEIQDTMAQLIPYETFAEVMEQNGWDVEASGDEIDALISDVDPAAIEEFTTFMEENCTTEIEPEG
jgi:hypothetical protein